jgi:hypothetical protein
VAPDQGLPQPVAPDRGLLQRVVLDRELLQRVLVGREPGRASLCRVGRMSVGLRRLRWRLGRGRTSYRVR